MCLPLPSPFAVPSSNHLQNSYTSQQLNNRAKIISKYKVANKIDYDKT
jgi:hypothetical protein